MYSTVNLNSPEIPQKREILSGIQALLPPVRGAAPKYKQAYSWSAIIRGANLEPDKAQGGGIRHHGDVERARLNLGYWLA